VRSDTVQHQRVYTGKNRKDILPFYRIADAVEALRPGVENSGHVREGVERCAFYDVQHGDARHAVFCFQKERYCAYHDGAAHAVSNKLIHALTSRLTKIDPVRHAQGAKARLGDRRRRLVRGCRDPARGFRGIDLHRKNPRSAVSSLTDVV